MFLNTLRVIFRCQRCSLPPITTIQASTAIITNLNQNKCVSFRLLHSDSDPTADDSAAKKKRTKTPEIPKITLLDENDKILTVTTLAEAEKIATGRKLKLIKIVDKDIRTVRSVYKLMSESAYMTEELNQRKQKKEEKRSSSYIKGEKLLVLSSSITSSDLAQKMNKVKKWLEKKYEVRAMISGSPDKAAVQEEYFKEIEKALKDKSRIVQKIYKSGNLKFHILPPKEEIESSGSSKESSSTDNTETVKSSAL